jgi:hypothetical protein
MLLEQLKAKFEAAGHLVNEHDETNAAGAAWYLGYREGGLKKRREKRQPPEYRVRPSGVWYPLAGLLSFDRAQVKNRAAQISWRLGAPSRTSR